MKADDAALPVHICHAKVRQEQRLFRVRFISRPHLEPHKHTGAHMNNLFSDSCFIKRSWEFPSVWKERLDKPADLLFPQLPVFT